MRRTSLLMLTLGAAVGCASTGGPAKPAPMPPAVASAPVLRLLEITPRDGARIDSSAELVATLAYHIPDFDPERAYSVSAVFAIAGGRTYNRGGRDGWLRSQTGIITVRQSLGRLWEGSPSELLTPLTGSFFLLEHDAAPAARDTVSLGDRARLVALTRRSTVRARTRTFHFNGGGPARTLGASIPDLLEEYWTYSSHKAIAVAYDDSVRWTYGYSYGHPSRDAAVARALQGCRTAAEQRGVEAPCRIVAIDEQGAEPPP